MSMYGTFEHDSWGGAIFSSFTTFMHIITGTFRVPRNMNGTLERERRSAGHYFYVPLFFVSRHHDACAAASTLSSISQIPRFIHNN